MHQHQCAMLIVKAQLTDIVLQVVLQGQTHLHQVPEVVVPSANQTGREKSADANNSHALEQSQANPFAKATVVQPVKAPISIPMLERT